MASKKTKYLNIYFHSVPATSAYFAGRVYDVPEDLANTYIEQGYARLTTKTLPNDIPAREELIANDLLTIAQVEGALDNLESYKGIGKSTADKIRTYFSAKKD